MSALSHNNAVRKLLHVAAVLATFACVSGATLVVSATTSPVMAQDITGTDQAQKIDQLQHAFDPAHYPKKDPPPPPPPPPPEKSWWEKCIDWLCGASDEEIKKQHDADLKKAVEERRKELGSEKKTEAPKPETKTSESRVTGFVKPVETVKASAIKVPATSKVETVGPRDQAGDDADQAGHDHAGCARPPGYDHARAFRERDPDQALSRQSQGRSSTKPPEPSGGFFACA